MSLYDEALLDQVAKLLATRMTPTKTTTTRLPDGVWGESVKHLFAAKDTRREQVLLARQMYAEDGRYENILETLARDITKGGFQVESDDGRIADLVGSMRDRLGIDSRLDDWCRLTWRDGDSFLELGVSADREIVEVSRKPTLTMRRHSNDFDKFDDPRHAYWFHRQEYANYPPPDAIWFADWQIIHVRWKHDENTRYGSPMLASGRKAWKRLMEGETDMAVRRKTRAGLRYHHVVEGDDTAVERYKEMNQTVLNNPLIAVADFFSNRPGGITAIQGDSNLGNIDDVLHHLETWWVGSPVPRALIGYGRDLNRDILQEQKDQYEETVDSIRKWVNSEIIRPLIDIELLLHGIVPEASPYSITWTAKAIVTPDDILKIAQACQALRLLGVPDQVIHIILAYYLPPGVDIEMLQAAIDTNDTARIANIASTLGALVGNG